MGRAAGRSTRQLGHPERNLELYFLNVMIISVARMYIQLGKLQDTSSTNEIT